MPEINADYVSGLLSDAMDSVPGRFVQGVASTTVKPLADMGQAYLDKTFKPASEPGGNFVNDLAMGLLDAHKKQFSKASESYKQGHYSEAAGHAVAGSVPLVGPAASDAGEQIGKGDVAGGLGAATGLVGSTLLPGRLGKANEATAAETGMRAALRNEPHSVGAAGNEALSHGPVGDAVPPTAEGIAAFKAKHGIADSSPISGFPKPSQSQKAIDTYAAKTNAAQAAKTKDALHYETSSHDMAEGMATQHIIEAKDAAGARKGWIRATELDPGKWRIGESELHHELRGKGNGLKMYEELVNHAKASGATELQSGGIVSPEAAKVWEKLSNKYPVNRISTPEGNSYVMNLSPEVSSPHPAGSPGFVNDTMKFTGDLMDKKPGYQVKNPYQYEPKVFDPETGASGKAEEVFQHDFQLSGPVERRAQTLLNSLEAKPTIQALARNLLQPQANQVIDWLTVQQRLDNGGSKLAQQIGTDTYNKLYDTAERGVAIQNEVHATQAHVHGDVRGVQAGGPAFDPFKEGQAKWGWGKLNTMRDQIGSNVDPNVELVGAKEPSKAPLSTAEYNDSNRAARAFMRRFGVDEAEVPKTEVIDPNPKELTGPPLDALAQSTLSKAERVWGKSPEVEVVKDKPQAGDVNELAKYTVDQHLRKTGPSKVRVIREGQPKPVAEQTASDIASKYIEELNKKGFKTHAAELVKEQPKKGLTAAEYSNASKYVQSTAEELKKYRIPDEMTASHEGHPVKWQDSSKQVPDFVKDLIKGKDDTTPPPAKGKIRPGAAKADSLEFEENKVKQLKGLATSGATPNVVKGSGPFVSGSDLRAGDKVAINGKDLPKPQRGVHSNRYETVGKDGKIPEGATHVWKNGKWTTILPDQAVVDSSKAEVPSAKKLAPFNPEAGAKQRELSIPTLGKGDMTKRIPVNESVNKLKKQFKAALVGLGTKK